MMNTLLRNMIRARAAATVAAAESLIAVNHSGLKGQLREILVTELLKPLLPANAGTANGEIVDAFDGHSSETDLIVYDKGIVPSLLLNSYSGIVPLDAAIFAIEVKSIVNPKEIKDTETKSKKLSDMRYSPSDLSPEAVIPFLFGFKSNLTTDRATVLDQYKTILEGQEPSIRSICVVGKGHWFYSSHKEGNEEIWCWKKVAASDTYDEVLSFVATSLDVYERVTRTRGQGYLGNYILSTTPDRLED